MAHVSDGVGRMRTLSWLEGASFLRLMQDKSREFKNAFDCLGKLVANEGPLALYKG